MRIPRDIASAALAAQRCDCGEEAMEHQRDAVHAAWDWGLAELSKDGSSPQQALARWRQLAGPEPERDRRSWGCRGVAATAVA
jgi:hypothetical protein